jgi:hypothetical protein
MAVSVRTYTITRYANPHLRCTECGRQVAGRRDDIIRNYPCGHKDYKNICYSWDPVDGCTCKESHG